MSEEPTDAELEAFISEIYWDLEAGKDALVLKKFRKMISDAQEREREKTK